MKRLSLESPIQRDHLPAEIAETTDDLPITLTHTPAIQRTQVAMLVRILNDEVEPSFAALGKPRQYIKYNIPSAPGGRAFGILSKIVVMLRDRMEEHAVSMPLEILARDYFTTVYQYYEGFNRKPFLNQLTPSVDNIIRWEDWIAEWEKDKLEDYWVDSGSSLDVAKTKARAILDQEEVITLSQVNIDIYET